MGESPEYRKTGQFGLLEDISANAKSDGTTIAARTDRARPARLLSWALTAFIRT